MAYGCKVKSGLCRYSQMESKVVVKINRDEQAEGGLGPGKTFGQLSFRQLPARVTDGRDVFVSPTNSSTPPTTPFTVSYYH
jgi:hypothetical protein